MQIKRPRLYKFIEKFWRSKIWDILSIPAEELLMTILMGPADPNIPRKSIALKTK